MGNQSGDRLGWLKMLFGLCLGRMRSILRSKIGGNGEADFSDFAKSATSVANVA